jgi:hypothetical protein
MSPRQTYWFLTGTAAGLVAGALGVYLLVGGARPTNTVTFNTEQSYEYMGRIDEARAARTYIAATEGSRISGTVRITADLARHAAPGTTLFIYATDANSPGPPLAVLRLRVDRWPVSFVLDDADAMIPERNLSASKSVQLEARISPSGEALPLPGDLVGTLANVDPRTTDSVNISIDHQII